MPELVLSSSSTNVRFRAPKAAPLFFRTLQAVGTEPVAAVLEQFFVWPRRAKLNSSEQSFLQSGRRETIESGRHRLAVWSWGEGRTVLVVHGWGSAAARFRTMTPALVDAGFRVVAFDGPGHGASTGMRSSLPETAQAIRAVATRQYDMRGAWPHAVIAHSFGSAASIQAELQGAARTRNIFLAPSTDFDGHLERLRVALQLDARVLTRMVQRLERRLAFSWHALSRPHAACAIATPSLIFHDPADAEVPYADAQLLQRVLPRAELIQLSGLGHRRLLHDNAVIERVIEFLR